MSLYRIVRWLVQLLVGFYFSRIELFHSERVPDRGPVLFASNHPNSLADAFIVGTSVPRKVHFVATVQLFRFKPLKWFLLKCGLIPINRVKDDPRAMRSVLDTFEACYAVLEQGEAIGIFPEGITHDDPQLKPIKTGTARMALDLEQRHRGELGLHIVPVGLNFSAKDIYRSDVLVHFGEPIRVADFLEGYEAHRKECIQKLSGRIEEQLQSLIVHVSKLDQVRLVEAVKSLYLDELRLGNVVISEPLSPQAEALVLTRAITDAVEFASERYPEKVEAFSRKLSRYQRWLSRWKISDAALRQMTSGEMNLGQSFFWAIPGVLASPVAIYGTLHRLAPAAVIHWALKKFANLDQHRAQVSTTSILAGLVSFGCFYSLYFLVAQCWFGWPIAFWYLLSLPVASLVAYYYWREARRWTAGVRNVVTWMRRPKAIRRLQITRAELIEDIERLRREYRKHLMEKTESKSAAH
jgi:glycerol-3-phosphate O-acyltransferase / dihydroxyacetone phosphate acyltransferase